MPEKCFVKVPFHKCEEQQTNIWGFEFCLNLFVKQNVKYDSHHPIDKTLPVCAADIFLKKDLSG